jgi:hypothetical protein
MSDLELNVGVAEANLKMGLILDDFVKHTKSDSKPVDQDQEYCQDLKSA